MGWRKLTACAAETRSLRGPKRRLEKLSRSDNKKEANSARTNTAQSALSSRKSPLPQKSGKALTFVVTSSCTTMIGPHATSEPTVAGLLQSLLAGGTSHDAPPTRCPWNRKRSCIGVSATNRLV